MLDEKNAAVILICKNRLDDASYEFAKRLNLNTFECIRYWIANYTGLAANDVGDKYVKDYLRDAVLDYIKNTSNPGGFITNIFQLLDKGYSEVEAYISSLRMVRVRDSATEYVNGFNEELIKPVSFMLEV